jgi:sugar O-acyltransferase (sialic acid O-acetyltransferase NeuD family)
MDFLIIGAGGHAGVVFDAMLQLKRKVIGFLDADPQKKGERYLGVNILGSDKFLDKANPNDFTLVNGIGHQRLRKAVQEKLEQKGWHFAGFIHPFASVSPLSNISFDVQVHAGAVVQANVNIDKAVIVNTSAVVDHDCLLGAWTHVAPNATLCGSCTIGSMVMIGAGAVLTPNTIVSEGQFIKANTLNGGSRRASTG